ncbi:sensor histidine kinase [Xanthomonas vasicola]|uniref:sensor histidine kinase n=1 Tax=Xanthomonas vasicola TaxID=56459 RepID=UPI00037F2C02|nr:sensor histidine kinase [Xanthomonas vasicola]KEZ95288.1 histidine kinase [Xanthomonas vasicola pv. vasculorum NCPPB 895]KFA37374.1 histidine kinase [Xanthomonas vasicola pv. vasculorum NCPPB 206]MBV7305941.1 sensor histidine kinase [Xanthomonas vasicola pv. vasculorum]MDO6935279.1 sensor histidine kinase [Xanthomonas vasicola]MDO6939121.1 sensor histidine kinase [Xanthomonas vasicola]
MAASVLGKIASMPNHSHVAQPLDTLRQAPVIVWTLLAGEGVAAVLALAPALDGNRWVYFGLASLTIQWVALLTLTCLYGLRRHVANLKPLQVATLSLALMLACTWAVCGATWAALHETWNMRPREWGLTFLRTTGIALTVGILGVLAFHNHWQARRLALEAKQAQLDALRARIRPHFLFNTLNTGAALIHVHPEQAERLLLDLSDLFRAAMSNSDHISLSEELALARRYLEIEEMRLGRRLSIDWQIPAALPDVQIPTLSIQPLVENAVFHGIEPSIDGGCVSLKVTLEGERVKIEITNPLPSSQENTRRGHQLGLAAVEARLETFGSGHAFLTTQRAEGTFISTLDLPAT